MSTKQVFLSIRRVLKRGHTVHKPLPVRYKAEWIARGSTHEVYISTACDTPEKAEQLAYAWLERQGGHYVDTTESKWWRESPQKGA